MNPELVVAIVGAALVVWAGYSALRATRSASRMDMLGRLLSALTFILIVRLVAPFGGWGDWFVWVWLVAVFAIIVAVYRAASVWTDQSWRAEEVRARRGEALRISTEAVLAVIVAGALVIPGLFL
jgi:hypothetical protein